MNNFKDIEFPENSNTDDVLESVGVTGGEHNELFTKFMKASKDKTSKSQVVKQIMSDNEFTDNEMKLIFLLAYHKASEIIQYAGEKVFKK